MTIIKILLLLLGLLLAAFGAMILFGMALSLLKVAVSIAVVVGIVWFLVKLFGGDENENAIATQDPMSKLQNAELTLDEYKRKLEEQLRQGPGNPL
jgi:hypothetical protein